MDNDQDQPSRPPRSNPSSGDNANDNAPTPTTTMGVVRNRITNVGNMITSPVQSATSRKANNKNDSNNNLSSMAADGTKHSPNRNRANSSGSGVVAMLHHSPSNVKSDNEHDSDYDDDDEDDDDFFIEEENRTAMANRVTQFDLCQSMWKRRGGLGRNAERKWVMRTFTLYGPILCYHEEPTIEQVTDPSKPRARLNLSKTETIAEMHSKRKPGLPTEDLLTINIYDPIIHSKRKWEMCCSSKEQQLVWYKAINAYNGKPIDEKQTEKEKGAGTGDHENAHVPISPVGQNASAYQMPDLSQEGPEAKLLRPASRGAALNDVELIAKAAAKAAEILNEKQSKQQSNAFHFSLMVVVLNVAIHFVRHGSEETYKLVVFFINAVALYGISQQYTSSKSNTSPRRGPKARAAAAGNKSKRKKSIADDGNAKLSSPSTPDQQSTNGNRTNFARTLPAGRTMPRAPPVKNSELSAQLAAHDPNSADAIRAYAAAPASSIQAQPHTYSNVDSKLFNLRIGPNYKKNKQKAPSAPALYDLISMDFLYADAPLKQMGDKFRLPNIPGLTDISTGHSHIPPLLVVNTWLPGEEPSMFAKNTLEGETYSIPLVFVLSKDTLGQLQNLETASPGVKLWSEWCKRAEKEESFRGRFKCMGMIENIENTGVPKFIQGYNGKPALVTKSGTFHRHANYIEFSINVNMWAFLARKGLYTLTPTFPDFIFNVGFTIEARKDEEMPEVLLGGCRLLHLDTEKAVVDGVDDVEI